MAYRQGDIVLVSFPFTDLTSTKRRPAQSCRRLNAAGEGAMHTAFWARSRPLDQHCNVCLARCHVLFTMPSSASGEPDHQEGTRFRAEFEAASRFLFQSRLDLELTEMAGSEHPSSLAGVRVIPRLHENSIGANTLCRPLAAK